MSIFNKKAEKTERKSFLFPDAMIYYEYTMPLPEKLLMFGIGFVLGFALGYVFYGLLLVSILLGAVVGCVLVPMRKKQRIDKQVNTLKVQFKSLLESVSTSIGAGRNITDSFVAANEDLREQFSAEAYIVRETANILSGLHNNINIEALLRDLADRSGIDDIRTFADVFDTTYRKGGDMKQVIASTYKIINDKIEIEMEIQTMIASSKSELNIMCCMPIVFMVILNGMDSTITGRGTTSGYIATTIALVIFAAAYFVGRKIMSIKM